MKMIVVEQVNFVVEPEIKSSYAVAVLKSWSISALQIV